MGETYYKTYPMIKFMRTKNKTSVLFHFFDSYHRSFYTNLIKQYTIFKIVTEVIKSA